jgi:hypothetical protein
MSQKKATYCKGTFWVIKEPEHGESANGVTGIDNDGNKIYSAFGDVYCANCEKWEEFEDTQKAISCGTCNAPYKANNWFPKKNYQIEINGKRHHEVMPYDEAIVFANTRRAQDNTVIVSATPRSHQSQ